MYNIEKSNLAMSIIDWITDFIKDYGMEIENIIVICIILLFLYVLIYVLYLKTRREKIIKILNLFMTNNDMKLEEKEAEYNKLNKFNNKDKEMMQKLGTDLNNILFGKNNPTGDTIIDSSELFNVNLFISIDKQNFIRTIINLFSAMGLLGTFIGLTQMLNTINNTSKIIESMKGAFITSIVGLITGIVCTIIFEKFVKKCTEEAENLSNVLIKLKPNNDKLYHYDMLHKITKNECECAVDSIVKEFLSTMKKELNEDLEEYKKSMQSTATLLNENNTNFNTFYESEKEYINSLQLYITSTKNNLEKYAGDIEEINKTYTTKINELNDNLNNANTSFSETIAANKENTETINSMLTLGKNLITQINDEIKVAEEGFKTIKLMTTDYNSNVVKEIPQQLYNSINILIKNIEEKIKQFDEINNTKTNVVEKEVNDDVPQN